jgi:hypothetical protein
LSRDKDTPPSRLKLSRAIGDRALLALLTLPIAILSGLGCWTAFIRGKPTKGIFPTVIQFLLHDAVLAVFALCILVLIWAVAAPRWMERLLMKRAIAALLAVLLAAIGVVTWLWFA